jgi:hypothetical protein
VRNVWRKDKVVRMDAGKRYRLTDVIWWTRQEDVFTEIASILEIDSASTQTPNWFQNRTRAAKNILDRMTKDETDILRDKADRLADKGLPEEVQRK